MQKFLFFICVELIIYVYYIIYMTVLLTSYFHEHIQKQPFTDVLQSALKNFALFWIKKSLQHKWFPVNIANFLRTAFLQSFSGGCFCIILNKEV